MHEEIHEESLAAEIVQLAQSSLVVNYRFFDRALFMMQPQVHETICGTDGRIWFYVPRRLLELFEQDRNQVMHLLLHSLLHAIFRHFFVETDMPHIWDIACDMMVEAIVEELYTVTVEAHRSSVLTRWKEIIQPFTAEKIYAKLHHEKSQEQIFELRELFCRDDHDLWYRGAANGNGSGMAPRAEERNHKGIDAEMQSPQIAQDLRQVRERHMVVARLAKTWKGLAKRMQAEIGRFTSFSEGLSNLTLQLTLSNRERQDYAVFMRKFVTSLRERLQVNPEEFDYTFYSYGMLLYGNIPLIEPLEYRDVKAICSFAIVLDTSGSVDRALLEQFLQKTYDCLMSEKSFTERFCVHIIQSDAAVQSDVCIRSMQELKEYMRGLTIKGRGGTDFRPALKYVETLRRSGELTNLKGVMYFTDGLGIFPAQKPTFETAFVYIGEEGYRAKVPAWATKVIFFDDGVVTST